MIDRRTWMMVSLWFAGFLCLAAGLTHRKISIIDHGGNSLAYTLDPGCYVSPRDSRWSDSHLIQHMIDRAQGGGCPGNTVTLDAGNYELDGPILAKTPGQPVTIEGQGPSTVLTGAVRCSTADR
jgi:hypothetical protein